MADIDYLKPPKVPPRIRMSGDRDGCTALLPRALKELTLLREQTGFQDLFQGKRTLNMPDGSIIQVRKAGEQHIVDLWAPSKPQGSQEEVPEEEIASECFCCCCFSEGVVVDRYGAWGDWGPLSYRNNPYPKYANESDIDISNYMGIRYKVLICQKLVNPNAPWAGHIARAGTWVCSPSDFTEYDVGDRVMCLFRGNWRGYYLERGKCFGCEQCISAACKANHPIWFSGNEQYNRCDGNFVIVPLIIRDVNEIDGSRIAETSPLA